LRAERACFDAQAILSKLDFASVDILLQMTSYHLAFVVEKSKAPYTILYYCRRTYYSTFDFLTYKYVNSFRNT